MYLNKLAYYFYIYQLLEYNNRAFLRWVRDHQGLDFPRKTRFEINWTMKAKLLFQLAKAFQLIFRNETHSLRLAQLFLKPVTALAQQETILKGQLALKRKRPRPIVVGISGSFGKTSTREFLRVILSEKYNVIANEGNQNTLWGVSAMLQQQLDSQTEVVVVEMGAYYPGDIRAVAKLVKPDHGIVTGVNNQHVEMFGSLQKAIDTELELAAALPKDGRLVINANNKSVQDNVARFKSEKVTQVNDGQWQVVSCETREMGIACEFQTPLGNLRGEVNVLGQHNAENILLCLPICFELGLSLAEIKRGLQKIKPFTSRLEPHRLENGAIWIDDTYNANVDGIKAGLKLLGSYQNRRKVYLTPGVVELGDDASLEHEKLGFEIGKVADSVLLVENSVKEALKRGLEGSGFDMAQAKEFPDQAAAQEYLFQNLAANDVALIQNDWPECYY